MGDLIDRQMAIDAIQALWNDAPSAQHMSAMFDCEDAIRVLPSAQPEIISCRNCRWRKNQSGSTAWLPCRAIVTPSDFSCCHAERRADEGSD